MDLQARIGKDCFLQVVEALVADVGLHKALRLRAVNTWFNWAVTYALCTSQVLKLSPSERLPLFINARIHLANSRKPGKKGKLLAAIADLNAALDTATLLADDEAAVDARHLLVAEALVGRHLGYEQERFQGRQYHTYTGGWNTSAQNLLGGAIVINDVDLVRFLLAVAGRAPEFVSGMTCFGQPLKVAAAFGRAEIFELLLENGASAQDPAHDFDAVVDPDSEIMRTECPHTPRITSGPAIQAAALAGSEAIVRRLLAERGDWVSAGRVTRSFFRACMMATRGGHVGIMRLLLAFLNKEPKHCQGLLRSMMFEACTHGQERAVGFLLDSGFDVTEAICEKNRGFFSEPEYRSILFTPASHGNSAITRLLLDRGVAPYDLASRDSSTPVHEAAQYGHEEVINTFLERRILPPHMTILNLIAIAAAGGQERLVKRLLGRTGTQVLATPWKAAFRDSSPKGYTLGHSLLWSAVQVKNPRIIRMLISLGVPLDQGWGLPIRRPLAQASSPWLRNLLLSLGAINTMTSRITAVCAGLTEREDLGLACVGGTWGPWVPGTPLTWVGKY